MQKVMAKRKLKINMENSHGWSTSFCQTQNLNHQGWTISFCPFQCSSADEHNASMQLERESFMVAVPEKEIEK